MGDIRGNMGRRAVIRAVGVAAGGVAVGGTSAAAAKNAAEAKSPVSARAVGLSRPIGRQVEVLWSVDTDQKKIALTFDDGPLPNWTPLCLDALDAAKVPATFFVVGSRLTENAGLLRGRIDRHEIANHTWDHDDLSRLGYEGVMRSISRTQEAIKEMTGRTATYLRPPWGKLGGTTVRVAGELDLDIALWSVLIQDRAMHDRPDVLVTDVVEGSLPGSILLGHEVGKASRLVTVQQLPRMIQGLRKRGFEFVTLTELREAGKPTRI